MRTRLSYNSSDVDATVLAAVQLPPLLLLLLTPLLLLLLLLPPLSLLLLLLLLPLSPIVPDLHPVLGIESIMVMSINHHFRDCGR